MPRPRKEIPAYRLDASHNCGRVVIAGYPPIRFPGAFNSPESLAAYRRWLAHFMTTGELRIPDPEKLATIGELVLAFTEQVVERRYVKNDLPTSEQASYRTALRPVTRLYCDIPAADFQPRDLKRCRDQLVLQGYTRQRINQHVQRIRRCFKWGVSEGMVPAVTWQALGSIEGLRAGEGGRESRKIPPVPDAQVEAVRPFVTPAGLGRHPTATLDRLPTWRGARHEDVRHHRR